MTARPVPAYPWGQPAACCSTTRSQVLLPSKALNGLLRPFRRRRGVRQFVSPSTAPQVVSCWTNPAGKVLTPVVDQVWGAERSFYWKGVDVGGRSAVVRLSDGSLWVHSPVQPTPGLQQACNELGEVKHIVSPNLWHTAFGKQWKDSYPSATLYGCPGLPAKQPHMRIDATVGVNNEAPHSWLGEIEVTHLSYEAAPLLRTPVFDEVIFLHKASRTLIVTDFFWSYPSDVPVGTKTYTFGMNRVFKPFYNSFMISDKERYREVMHRIFDEWQWDAILPCHGNFVSAGGKALLRKHLDLPPPQLIRRT